MKFFDSFGLSATILSHLPCCLGHAVAPAPTALAVLETRGDDDTVRFACDYLTANPKYNTASNHHNLNCRLDPTRRIWGVCGPGIERIADCGIAGACVDGDGCKNGCGLMGQPGTTVTCSEKVVCSSAFVFYGSRDYKYIGCGTTDRVDSYTLSPAGPANATATPAENPRDTPTGTEENPTQTKTPLIEGTRMATMQASASNNVGTSSSLPEATKGPTALPQPKETNSSTNHSNTNGVIIGASVGGAALLTICSVGAYLLYRQRKSQLYPSTEKKLAKVMKEETSDRPDTVWSPQPGVATGQRASVMSESITRYELEG